MIKITPIITEKSIKDAKSGKYTFKLPVNIRKNEVKNLINELFGVHVKKVWTMKKGMKKKMTISRKIKKIKAYKKVIVSLSDKEKIDVFETKNK